VPFFFNYSGDLGIDVDIKNIRSMFTGGGRSGGGSNDNAAILERKKSLDALRVGNSDERREMKRREKRERRLAEQNKIISDSKNERLQETPAPSTATTTKMEAAPETKTESGDRFDTDEIKALEVGDQDDDDDDDNDSGVDESSEDEEEVVDEEVVHRGTALFHAIDLDSNGEIKKSEFLAALDHGNLEMTDEIKM
jgi:hypothetical protein